jgi:hypothetical protein
MKPDKRRQEKHHFGGQHARQQYLNYAGIMYGIDRAGNSDDAVYISNGGLLMYIWLQEGNRRKNLMTCAKSLHTNAACATVCFLIGQSLSATRIAFIGNSNQSEDYSTCFITDCAYAEGNEQYF